MPVPLVVKLTEPEPKLTLLVTPMVFELVTFNAVGVVPRVRVAAPSPTVILVETVLRVTATLPKLKVKLPDGLAVLAVDVPPIVPVPVAVMEILVPVSTP